MGWEKKEPIMQLSEQKARKRKGDEKNIEK